MKEAIILSRQILSAHPNGVRSLFLRYGIGAEPTPRSIILATQAFGQPFIDDLSAVATGGNDYTGSGSLYQPQVDYLSMAQSGYDQNLATAPLNTGTTDTTKKKGFNLDSILNVFGKVAGVVNVGAETWNTIKTGQTPQTNAQAAQDAMIQQQQFALNLQAQQEAASAKTRQYLIVGGILVLVVVAAVFIFRKK
jgi:hypothetical protein